MRASPVTLAGAALVLLLASAGEARAEFINWTYSWSNSPGQINADKPGSGYITLDSEGVKPATGDSDIVATNLHTFSNATGDNPDRFTHAAYTLRLTLTDSDSSQSHTLVFTGELNGTLTAGSANISNTFTGQITQEVVLGNHLYRVTMTTYSPPGPPGAINAGSISGHTITLITVATLPEPSSLALTCLGAAVLGFRRWRCRRARRARRRAARQP
jgi:hypothetical protein